MVQEIRILRISKEIKELFVDSSKPFDSLWRLISQSKCRFLKNSNRKPVTLYSCQHGIRYPKKLNYSLGPKGRAASLSNLF